MDRIDTRAALLDAAELAVRSRGHDGFSYADLSEKIGIRKASIHYHFPSKSDLLVAIMERYRTQMEDRLANIEQGEATAAERLRAFLEIYRTALNDCTTVCLCVAFSVGQDRLPDAALEEIRRYRSSVTTWLAGTFSLALEDETIDQLTTPNEESLALLSLAEGAQISARFEGDLVRFDATLARFTSRLIFTSDKAHP